MIISILFLLQPGRLSRIMIISGAYSQVSQEYSLQEIRETQFMAIDRPKEHKSEYRYSKMV